MGLCPLGTQGSWGDLGWEGLACGALERQVGLTLQCPGFLCSCLACSGLTDLQGLSLGCTPGLPRLLLVTTLQVSHLDQPRASPRSCPGRAVPEKCLSSCIPGQSDHVSLLWVRPPLLLSI